jgi:predicted butyrate kinase (DUF1464 family)
MDPNIVETYEPRNRRQLRSRIPYQAAEIYLAKHRVQHGLRAIALADGHGLPLASVGAVDDAELMALWGALDETERQRYQGEMDAVCSDAVCVSRRFQIDDETFSLTAIGQGEGFGATIELDLMRILSDLGDLSH